MDQTLQDDRLPTLRDWANSFSEWDTSRYNTEGTTSQRVTADRRSMVKQLFSDEHHGGHTYVSEQANKKARFRRLAVVHGNQTSDDVIGIGHNFVRASSEPYITELASFFGLGEDWDGDGAKAIPRVAIYQSINFLSEVLDSDFFSPPSDVAASPEGEVLIFWGAGDGYIEINFDGDGESTVCFRSNGQMVAIEDEEIAEGNFRDSETFLEVTKKLRELRDGDP